MNMKKTVRKMSAILAGATMVGATVMGAMAYDLSDYPSPFIKDGFFTGKIVVGEKAMPSDIIGASDIAAALQADAKTAVSTGGSISVAGGVSEEVTLGGSFQTPFGVMDNSDVAALKEGSVTLKVNADKETYDFHEELSFDDTKIAAETGLTYGTGKEDFKDGVYLMMARGAIRYDFVFDDLLDGDVTLDDITADDTAKLEILGQTVEITDVDAAQLTVKTGDTLFMNVGEKVKVGSSEITLVKVGDGVVYVSVDGETATIEKDDSDYVGELTVEVKSVFNDEGTADDSAVLLVSTDDEDTYQNGDAFIGEDEEDPSWTWVLAGLNTTTPTIGVEWRPTVNGMEDKPVTVGQSVSLPNDYLKVSLVDFNQADYQKYTVGVEDGVELYAANGDDIAFDGVAVLSITSEGTNNDAFKVNGEETDKVVIYSAGGRTYTAFEDDGNSNRLTITYNETDAVSAAMASLFTLEYKKTSIDAQWNNVSNHLTFDLDGTTLSVLTEAGFAYLGDEDGDTVAAGEVAYGAINIQGWEEDTMAEDGTIIYSYDASASGDELVFAIPGESSDFAINVAVLGGAGAVSTASTGSAYSVHKFEVGATVLDKDAMSLIGKTPLIVVGGPRANTVAAQLMDNPTSEQISTMFTAGLGKIKLYTAKNALLVAGYSAQDTLGACYVLADYDEYELTGTEVEVVVPSLTALSVRTPQ